MKESISKKELREFGFLTGFGIPIFIGWLIPLITGHTFRIWTILIGTPFLFLGIIRPFMLYYPYKLWMALGHILGWVNSRILLGLVFLTILQPIALFMKVFGYDPLRINKKERKKISFREPKKKNHKIDLTRIF